MPLGWVSARQMDKIIHELRTLRKHSVLLSKLFGPGTGEEREDTNPVTKCESTDSVTKRSQGTLSDSELGLCMRTSDHDLRSTDGNVCSENNLEVSSTGL